MNKDKNAQPSDSIKINNLPAVIDKIIYFAIFSSTKVSNNEYIVRLYNRPNILHQTFTLEKNTKLDGSKIEYVTSYNSGFYQYSYINNLSFII